MSALEVPMSHAEEEELEINFRLDRKGRTIQASDDDSNVAAVDGEKDYDFQTLQTSFVSRKLRTTNDPDTEWNDADEEADESSILDDLLLDAEIADSGLLPRTFWVASQGQARCSLEQLALDIFHHHTRRNNMKYDASCSGAEWWVQIRPSPKGIGRYAMMQAADVGNHQNKEKDTTDKDDMVQNGGISFHWDKDEDLRLLCGGTCYVHPHWSTVTYLTEYGAPTLALNARVDNLTGAYVLPTMNRNDSPSDTEETSRPSDQPLQHQPPSWQGFVCWPKVGKHFCFDGRFLHAAPPDLMEAGAFQKQQLPLELANSNDTNAVVLLKTKKLTRRHRRVTFLVNIWLNYHPFNVEPFPDSMMDKMSGYQRTQDTAPACENEVNDDKEQGNNSTSRRMRLRFDGSAPIQTVVVDEPLGGQPASEHGMQQFA
jgi:hypothetical protein